MRKLLRFSLITLAVIGFAAFSGGGIYGVILLDKSLQAEKVAQVLKTWRTTSVKFEHYTSSEDGIFRYLDWEGESHQVEWRVPERLAAKGIEAWVTKSGQVCLSPWSEANGCPEGSPGVVKEHLPIPPGLGMMFAFWICIALGAGWVRLMMIPIGRIKVEPINQKRTPFAV